MYSGLDTLPPVKTPDPDEVRQPVHVMMVELEASTDGAPSSPGRPRGGSDSVRLNDFPPTGEFIGRLGRGAPDSGDAFRELYGVYRRPVLSYLQAGWSKSNADAEDLVQAFFTWLFESRALGRYDPGRGRFRWFLKSLLRHFVSHQEEAARCIKRGRGRSILPIDDRLERVIADRKAEPPEQAFDRTWRREIMLGAVNRVRERMAAEGHALSFLIFESYALREQGEGITYAEIARFHGIKESAVRNHLWIVREALREETRARVAAPCRTRQEIEEEWNDFLRP